MYGWGPDQVGALTIPQYNAYSRAIRQIQAASNGKGLNGATHQPSEPSTPSDRSRSRGTVDDPNTNDEMLAAVKRLQKATGKMEFPYNVVKREMAERNHG